MKELKFFTSFRPPVSVPLKCEDASLTRQEFVQDSDLNNIMKRYAAGVPLPSGSRPPLYGDFSEVPDFQKAFQIVQDAQSAFDSLPSKVRDRFANDPARLLDFLSKKENFEEGVRLGLFKAPGNDSEKVSVPPATPKGGSDEPPPTTTT